MKDAALTSSPLAVPASGLNALAIAVAASIAIAAVFASSVGSMVAVWRSSETYGHGYFVVPIVLWLLWRQRAELARIAAAPCWPGLALVSAAGLLWLVGALASANVVEHFAVVLMIHGAIVVAVGLQVARAIAFPLAFLLFAVPVGEAFVPQLMDWTADFTVTALKLTAIPVYREGNAFVIPSGRWSIVEACSGIRYVIASLMAGTLFAFVTYTGMRRRAIFVAASLVVPVVANWLRAYLIVMLGHLSGNELAAGVDHLIYGWIFFGFVLVTMFWVGARFRQDPVGDSRQLASAMRPDAPVRLGSVVAASLVAFAVAAVWSPIAGVLATWGAERPRALTPIEGVRGWRAASAPADGWIPHFSGQQSTLRQAFERDGERVVVQIAYYAAQAPGRELVNSGNVIVAANDARWRQVERATIELPWRGGSISARSAALAGDDRRVAVAWWYWIDGRATGSDAVAKLALAWSRLTLRADDSAAVFLSTETSQRTDAQVVLRAFAADMGGAIEHALAATRDGAPR